jgi:transcriptional regulator of arginine metabolism
MRKKRLSEILTIIREHEIENQDMLLAELRKRGYNVTQATISRDITYLRLEKTQSASGTSRYAERGTGGSAFVNERKLFTSAIRRADYAMNTVVLKCDPGWAGAVCAAFEKMNLTPAVGTIAGDDTVFVLMRTENDARTLFAEILDMM